MNKKASIVGVSLSDDGTKLHLSSNLEQGETVFAIAREMFSEIADFKKMKVVSLTLEFEDSSEAQKVYDAFVDKTQSAQGLYAKARRIRELLWDW